MDLTISNPAASLDGVEFTGTAGGHEQRFLVNRDALEDIEYTLFEKDELMLKAFERHRFHISRVAQRALEEGRGGPKTVVLQSLLP